MFLDSLGLRDQPDLCAAIFCDHSGGSGSCVQLFDAATGAARSADAFHHEGHLQMAHALPDYFARDEHALLVIGMSNAVRHLSQGETDARYASAVMVLRLRAMAGVFPSTVCPERAPVRPHFYGVSEMPATLNALADPNDRPRIRDCGAFRPRDVEASPTYLVLRVHLGDDPEARRLVELQLNRDFEIHKVEFPGEQPLDDERYTKEYWIQRWHPVLGAPQSL